MGRRIGLAILLLPSACGVFYQTSQPELRKLRESFAATLARPDDGEGLPSELSRVLFNAEARLHGHPEWGKDPELRALAGQIHDKSERVLRILRSGNGESQSYRDSIIEYRATLLGRVGDARCQMEFAEIERGKSSALKPIASSLAGYAPTATIIKASLAAESMPDISAERGKCYKILFHVTPKNHFGAHARIVMNGGWSIAGENMSNGTIDLGCLLETATVRIQMESVCGRPESASVSMQLFSRTASGEEIRDLENGRSEAREESRKERMSDCTHCQNDYNWCLSHQRPRCTEDYATCINMPGLGGCQF